jgi:D-alanyl-D-alanine dipeptidase
LEKIPAEQRAHDAEGKSWWEVVVRGQAQGAAIRGWVCEEGMQGVSWQSPWAWPGFDIAEEGDIQPVDLIASWLIKLGASRAEEYRDHKMRADKVDRSELLKQIYQQLDTDNDGHLTKQELLAAAKQPLLAEALSHLIVRYESEWGGDDAKWNELDPLMLDGTPEWAAEKLRIMKLRWWSEVAPRVPGFPKSPEVFHIHPIGLLNNFFSPLPAANKAVTAAKTAQPSDRKSGAHWHSYFPQSADIADLKEPFQSNVRSFITAMKDAGVAVNINTTLRPPQRSYLMYYAREIASGNLAPKDVPAFEPQNGDQPVDIDWEHRDASGKPDPDAAKKGASALDSAYGAEGAIGKPYRSNHNGGEAIDMRFIPDWAIGKSVAKKSGDKVDVTSKQDLIDIGASYDVLHWNYAGAKPKKDNPHWSKTGT